MMMKMKEQNEKRDRGSALLVSLMVMVGLTLLGLGFVAISETESAISVNERNYSQTLHAAEAGARVVTEWFNAPEWALNAGLMPANTAAHNAAFKRSRNVKGVESIYRPDISEILFDYPLKGDREDELYGVDADNADFVIDYSTTEGAAFLNTFNERLMGDKAAGELIDPNVGIYITRISVYAPPVVGDTKAASTIAPNIETWQDDGNRYGVATIAVTAEKLRDPSLTPADAGAQTIARRTVKAVVGEFPFPGPEGPLQSNAGIGTNGAFRVHWGKIISLADMGVKRDHQSLPWIDAWTPIEYENDYTFFDSSLPQKVAAPEFNSYNKAADYSYLNDLIIPGGTTPSTAGLQFEDPWFQARARGAFTHKISSATPGDPQPYKYTPGTVENAGDNAYSNQFQDQDSDVIPTKKEAIFVRPVYQFWKQIAMTGATQQGINYLRYNSGTGEWYDVRGNSQEFEEWVDATDQGEEGFYFFDTLTGGDPQNDDGTTNTAILTPAISMNSSNAGPDGDFQMRGFVYFNGEEFGTTGISGPDGWYNAPGEPFRDIGVHVVDPIDGKYQCEDPITGNPDDCPANFDESDVPIVENYTNYRWDYQDLNQNGQFDYVVEQRVINASAGSEHAAGNPHTVWLPVPYYEGCGSSGGGGTWDVGTDCSEPHEPYLNLIYPYPDATGGSGVPIPFRVGWEDPTQQTRAPKRTLNSHPTGTLATCGQSATALVKSTDQNLGGYSNTDCTSNAYDELGGMVDLGDGPILDGVFYTEGDFDSSGNGIYYGSVLVWGTVDGTGNPDLFYDFKLSTGDWQERFQNLPRTIITSIETDQ